MSVTATVTMILILILVWGGFLLTVFAATRKERDKTMGGPSSGTYPSEGPSGAASSGASPSGARGDRA